MNKKVELEVLEISDTQAQSGAYVMLLGEIAGTRKLPIIIGASEAQATTIMLKGVKTPRPLTHDLFYTCLSVLGTQLQRILIYKVEEGVFYSYIYLKQNESIVRIDARTSDAVVLALKAKVPIFIYESILEKERICLYDIENEDRDYTDEGQKNTKELESALKEAIQKEDYELAANIRDEIKKRQ